MIVPFAKVYNASTFLFPPDDPHFITPPVPENPVKLAHNLFISKRHSPTAAIASLWLHGTHLPDTIRS